MTGDRPNPGSVEAVQQGCTCPVLDNNHGRGAWIKDGEPTFWISGGCPVHKSGFFGQPEEEAALEAK